MAERPRDACIESVTLRDWVTLRLNFAFYVTFCANICAPLHWGMVILQLCLWEFSHKET